MTAPAETRYPLLTLQEEPSCQKPDEQGEATVSFLYRNRHVRPQNVAPRVQVEDQPPLTVVSLGVRGSYTFSSYKKPSAVEQLA
jgi:hypothetical protein